MTQGRAVAAPAAAQQQHAYLLAQSALAAK
jgi:hypothetical protein